MKFADLTRTYAKLEILSGNALRAAVASFLKTVPGRDMRKVIYMTLGGIASDYDNVNLGMADKMIVKAIALSAGVANSVVKKEYKRRGDVGKVAEALAKGGTVTLQADDVFETLHSIAKTQGAGSQERKSALFARLLKKATPLEARYLSRLAVGKLRLGVQAKTIMDGLAQAYAGSKDAKKDLEYAYNICPDAGIIAETIVKKGLRGVKSIGVVVGRPVQMMLCQRVKSLPEVFSKLGAEVAVEQKYDGERVQIHKNGKKVVLYSRRLEDTTAQFPDIVSAVLKNIKAQKCILEAEIMAVKSGALQPFQVLMSRRRKHDIEAYVKKIPVKVFCFELLYVNGKSLIDKSYVDRYKALRKIVKADNSLGLARRDVCKDVSCVQKLFGAVVGKGGEGVVLKSLRPDSSYEAGVRGWHWVKWKAEYAKGLQDTFDLVVIGAFWGKGRRSGRYGALLCAVYNKKRGVFESACKLGSGFSDADLAGLNKKLKAVKEQPKQVVVLKSMKPDAWIQPVKVVEVLAAEITTSPLHAAGAVDGGKGLALRFPRFVRWRDDKSAKQATTTAEIKRMR